MFVFSVFQQVSALKLTAPGYPDGLLLKKNQINAFSCSGSNLSPELQWSEVPAGTKSFVLTMYDKDALSGGNNGWCHWFVTNIPSTATGLKEGAGSDISKMPAGCYIHNSDYLNLGITGSGGYGGPCPPVKHKFQFTLYALSISNIYTQGGVKQDSTATVPGFFLNYAGVDKVLAKAQLSLYYGKGGFILLFLAWTIYLI